MEAARWPLVGREAAWRALTAALTDQRGRGLVVTGPAGVGRTRLAREALAFAAHRGHPTRWAAATGVAAHVPFGALAHLLPAVDVGANDLALLQQATQAIAGNGSGPAPVLGVDDVHLLDRMSVTLLHQLAASGTVTLVLTVRPGATGSDPAAPLWKDGLAARIELQPLSRSDTDALLCRVLDGDVDTRTAQRLWRLSRGTPLFLRELLEDGLRTGQLRSCHGLWRWEGQLRPSERLCEIVLAQLEGLDATEWRALEVLATAEPLPVGDLEALSSPHAVARLERRGILTDDVDGRTGCIRAAHPIYTEVIRTRAPEAALRLIRRQLPAGCWGGGTLDAQAGRSPGPWDGNAAVDARQLTDAARRAIAELDLPRAEQLARTAVDAGGGAAAQLVLAEVTRWLGQPARSERLAAEAARLAATDDDRVEATVVRALTLACALGRVDDGKAVLAEEAAVVHSEGNRLLRAAAEAVLAFLGGDPRRAVRQATSVLSAAEPGSAAWPLAAAAAALGLAVTGATGRALSTVARAWTVLESLDRGTELPFVRISVAQAEVMALHLGGRIDDLARRAADLHRSNLAAPEWPGDAVAALHRGWAALAAGRMRVAVRWFLEADSGLRRADPVGMLGLCRSLLAIGRALLGDGAAARELGSELADGLPEAVPVYAPLGLLARAWVAAADSHTAEAGRLGLLAADRAADQGQAAVEAFLLHSTFRFRGSACDLERLRELSGRLESPLFGQLTAHVEAVLAEAGGRLDLLSREFQDAGLLLMAADAAAAAAAVHERKGGRRPAAASRTRAMALARECGLTDSPSLELLSPPALTSREEEVARLASRGLSNVAIADELVVSVRTVEAHLSHIYGKLGIGSRAELAGALVAAATRRPRRGPPHSGSREVPLHSPGLSARR